MSNTAKPIADKEGSFEETLADMNKTLDNIVVLSKYWKERCLAAEKIVEISGVVNCEGYENWEQLKNKPL